VTTTQTSIFKPNEFGYQTSQQNVTACIANITAMNKIIVTMQSSLRCRLSIGIMYLKPALQGFIGGEFCDGKVSNKSEDIIFVLVLR